MIVAIVFSVGVKLHIAENLSEYVEQCPDSHQEDEKTNLYLHSNDGIDEEQHRDQKNDVGQGLQTKEMHDNDWRW